MKVIGVTGGVGAGKRFWDILQNIGMQLLWKQMKWGIWSCGREKPATVPLLICLERKS